MSNLGKEYGLYDPATGELFKALILPIKQRVGGRWVRIFQDTLSEINKKRKLRGESYRVLLQLMAESDYKNVVPEIGKIANELGINKNNVSRAFRELRDAGILISEGRNYYLLPFLVWKGNAKQLNLACSELNKIQSSKEVKALN